MGLRHSSSMVLNKLFSCSLQNTKEHEDRCTIYPCAKQTKLPFISRSVHNKAYLDLIYVDV